ncbi:hypothetical protein A4X09_0g796 [Tilletia walkeri]|uniref:AAA+ ATPase domain-containing protein n=1 Tax=Tilletia walkeri TaxID=117179 RepID=A0A8X7NEE9_9BASI|nr:hypothetical protein A4X09_0g796 [Tilletia walkeri]
MKQSLLSFAPRSQAKAAAPAETPAPTPAQAPAQASAPAPPPPQEPPKPAKARRRPASSSPVKAPAPVKSRAPLASSFKPLPAPKPAVPEGPHKQDQLWAHAHGPQHASQVLGALNQASAIYLRDWLQELILENPLSTSQTAQNPSRRTATDLLMRPSKRQKLPMLGGKKGKNKEETLEPGRRKIQRKVDKKGEREKKAKAAKRARRHDWSALDDSDDEICDFVVDDEADLGCEAEEDIVDWDEGGGSLGGSQVASGSQTPLTEVPVAGPSTPKRVNASRPHTPLSSSPVIGPGRVVTAKEPSPSDSTPLSSRTVSACKQSPAKVTKTGNAFGDHLTNCILIEGPTGVGKTAAVYACAAELGFEVFELFPGVGRRTGKEIESAVGALAANHMVAGGGSGGGAGSRNKKKGIATTTVKEGSIMAAFKKMSGAAASAKSEGKKATKLEGKERSEPLAGPSRSSTQSPSKEDRTIIIIDDDDDDPPPAPAPVPAPKGRPLLSPTRLRHPNSVRQSLILIEEADILFEEDKGFWPALVQLIGRSRRPVIITCNDISAVPVEDLPLQTTLTFAPPTSEEVGPYLQRIAEQERHKLSSTDAIRLYESTSSPLDGHSLSLAGLVEGGSTRAQARAALWGTEKVRKDGVMPVLDLRLAMNELQFWCGIGPAPGSDGCSAREAQVMSVDVEAGDRVRSEEMCTLKDISRYLDALSFAESNLQSSFSTVIEVYESDTYHPLSASGARNQLQHEHAKMFLKPAWRDEEQVKAEWIHLHTERLRETCFSLVSSLWPSAPGLDCTREMQGRIEYSELLSMLGKEAGSRPLIANPSLSRPPSSALVLDYAPYIRTMVRADDIEAARHAEDVQAAKAAACAEMDGGKANPFLQLRLTRNTRNSQQSVLTAYGIFGGEEYARYVYADEGTLEAVRKGGFPELAEADQGGKAGKVAADAELEKDEVLWSDVPAQVAGGHI